MWKRLFEKFSPSQRETRPESLTLKERVAAFWNWYASVADRFYQEIENKRCGDLEPEVSAKVDELLNGMAWVFGPGEGGKGHSFTLTPEGDDHKRIVAQYWLECAPKLEGWTFYASRQPSSLCSSGHSIGISGMKFGAHEIWLTPQVDGEKEIVHLTVWHPLFGEIAEDLRWTVTFLWLDEALGEDGVVGWIGKITLGDDKLAGAIPLSELPEFIGDLESKNEWKKLPPHQSACAYQRKEPERGSLRNDIVAGSTSLMSIVHDYPMDEDTLRDFGASYEMVVIPTDRLMPGKVVAVRGEVQDALDEAFQKERSGSVLGGATGLDNAYIDMVLYDGNRSRRLIKSVLAATPYADCYDVASFTAGASRSR